MFKSLQRKYITLKKKGKQNQKSLESSIYVMTPLSLINVNSPPSFHVCSLPSCQRGLLAVPLRGSHFSILAFVYVVSLQLKCFVLSVI